MDKSPNILWLNEIRKDDIPSVGGKGASLGEMTSIGLPVPQGFVVTAQAFRRFLQLTKLEDSIFDILEKLDVDDNDALNATADLVKSMVSSAVMPEVIKKEIIASYQKMGSDTVVAVRSSATAEDLPDASFAGQQDTYLNMVGADKVVEAYHWDCASAYNLRSMTYRREAILDAILLAEESGDESIGENAKKEWAIEHTSLSVCMMQMINPMISGTAFSADTATGCRGTTRKDLVSIDASYGLGEAVVGGKVTPDKLYVFQRDDGNEVVIRQMGCKDMKIVYDERGGTREVEVPELEALRWALSLSQAQLVARGVRAVSKAYGGMIMDTEFCIDANDKLWFVQARPETRWNEELERHPHTIFMRRREVDPKAAEQAEVIVEGNGASRGAGHGTVRFLRSALELNKVSKGDVLAAERTDPDMVPGMRVASAIMADVGGDTSHAAITSRELGIAAVIGIQRLDVLRALDGAEVTVDGTRGRVYRGLLPLREVGGEMDISKLPVTKTKVGLVLADVGQALFLSRLRDFPKFEVGLLRAEFMLGNISIHPQALEAFDTFLEKHPDDPQTPWIKRSRDEVHNIMAERIYNIGKFYMDAKKYDVAQRYFSTVIRDYTKTKPASAAEQKLAEIDKEYKAKGLHWTPERRAFQESGFPREDAPIIHTPVNEGRWLLPIRDVKGGTIERDKKQEVVTDDML